MPVHVTTDTNQTISGDKTFTGLVSSQSGFIFPDGTTQTQAFVGGFMPLSGGDINGNMTVDGTISSSNQIYALNGNSSQWNNTFNVVQSNSATTWNYQGTDIKALTGNWQASYTALTSTSASWNDTRSVVQTNSAAWAIDNTTDTGVRALTSNWQNSYTALTSTSANWNDTRNTVQSNSATTWNYQGTDVKALTGNWQNSYTALTSTSANWNDVRSTVQNNSATTWNPAGVYLPLSGGTLTGALSVGSTSIDSGIVFLESTAYPARTMAIAPGWIDFSGVGISVNKTCRVQYIPLAQSSSAIEVSLPNQSGLILTDASNLDAAKLTNTIDNGRLPTMMSGLSSVTSNTFVGNLSGTASNNLPLSGGTVTGATRFDSNVTIFGNLSCSGTQTFQNTIFSTTSAVSVVHTGSGPALWVGNNGDGDIASFYDIDTNVEVLHVGGNNGSFPNVGVKTSTPNVDFTVNGAISASSIIYSASGNSDQWNSTYSTVQTNSATAWNYQGTDVKALTGNWDDTRNTVQNNSATTWNYQGTDVKDLTGNWQASYTALTTTSANWNDARSTVQTNSATIWNYQGTDVKSLTSNWQNSYTALTSTSANWDDARSTVQANSATTWNYQGTDVKALTSNWQNSYTSLTSTSANWDDTRNTVQNNSATAWNYQGTDVKSLTSNWENTYSTVQTNSAAWAGSSFVVEDANTIIGLSMFL